jgi:hypothetical protein
VCTKWGEGNRPRAAHALSKVMTLAEAAGGGLLKHGPTAARGTCARLEISHLW